MALKSSTRMSVMSLVAFFFCLLFGCYMATAKVVLIGSNVSLSFDDIEANFGEYFYFCFTVS